jgi:toxin ParE1/3/4
MAKVIWAEPAVAQLDAIAEIIALDKPEAAKAMVTRVFLQTDRLSSFPRIGRLVPEFRHTGYRQLWINPIWIYFRVKTDSVCILHVRRAEMPLDVTALQVP